MRTTSRPLAIVLATLLSLPGFAQNNAPNWLVDTLYSSGKMYTVIAVFSVVLLGLLFWMFRLDRRLKRMEESADK